MEQDHYTKTLIKNLKAIRKSKGLTATDVAEVLDVSQAKISYIENGKGVLSARDIAVLSSRLNIPVIEFFKGLEEIEGETETSEVISHLVRYGAVLLTRRQKLPINDLPFEEVFANALGFLEDDRLQKGFCAALITQAASAEIHIDRVFAQIGNNPFLLAKTKFQAELCLRVIEHLLEKKFKVNPRAKRQIQKIASLTQALLGKKDSNLVTTVTNEDVLNTAEFVEDCLNARR